VGLGSFKLPWKSQKNAIFGAFFAQNSIQSENPENPESGKWEMW